MKVLIFSAPKTGSTALFIAVKNSLPKDTRAYHEPRTLHLPLARLSRTPHLVIKLHATTHHPSKTDLQYFDRSILLVRDPRDTIISMLLYNIAGMHFSERQPLLDIFVQKLRQKEQAPQSVPLCELFYLRRLLERQAQGSKREAGNIRYTLEDIRKDEHLLEYKIGYKYSRKYRRVPVLTDRAGFDYFVHFAKKHQDILVLQYESFVEGKLAELSSYLGLPVNNTPDIPDDLKHVIRSKASGNWKHWFTEEDIRIFQPRMQYYIDHFGYDRTWTLPQEQHIDPHLSSEYMEYVIHERRRRRAKTPMWKKSVRTLNEWSERIRY